MSRQTEETISGMLFPCQCPVTVSLNWSYASTPWLYEATQMVPSPSSAIYSMARSPRHSTFLNLSAAGSYAITPTEVQRKIFPSEDLKMRSTLLSMSTSDTVKCGYDLTFSVLMSSLQMPL